MYPTQLHSYLLWRSSVEPNSQALASRRYTASVSLLPASMVGIFVFGWWAGWIVFLSILAAFFTDFICHRFIYAESPGTRDGSWLLTGLLLGLMMPPNVPWWLPVCGAVIAIFIGKHYLSVDGMPLLQPAAVGLLIMHLLTWNYMKAMDGGIPQWPVLSRGVETSMEDVRNGRFSKPLRDYFGGDVRKSVSHSQWSEKIFAGEIAFYDHDRKILAEAWHEPRPLDKVKHDPSHSYSSNPRQSERDQYEWLNMVLGYVPATIGGSSGLALGFGILLLIFSGAVSWVIPAFAMGTLYFGMQLLAWMYGSSNGAQIISENIPIHLMTGSTLIAIFYLAADPSSAPRSFRGKMYAGMAMGIFELILRLFTPLAEGLFISIILAQSLSFYIDRWTAIKN